MKKSRGAAHEEIWWVKLPWDGGGVGDGEEDGYVKGGRRMGGGGEDVERDVHGKAAEKL